MRKLFLMTMCLCAMAAGALGVKDGSVQTLVDSCGFFPQISYDGQWLLYSPTDASQLMLKNLNTGLVKTIAVKNYPGFDAIFGADGKVYYITQERRNHNLLYRTAHCYDPVTGKTKDLLKKQHGRLQAINTSKGIVVNGERKIYRTDKQVGAYVYTRGDMLYLVDESGSTRTLQPVQDSNGYLWASLSPDGTKVMFEAAAKGLYVIDLEGNIVAELGAFLMPCWYNNNYIVAMSNAGNARLNGSRLWLLSLNGEVYKPLTPETERAVQPMVCNGKIVYTIQYSGKVKMMELDIEPASTVADINKKPKSKTENVKNANKQDVPRVFINPGHGGHDSDDRHQPTWVVGAQNTLHFYESDANLNKGIALDEILRNKGYETVLSRKTNRTEDDLDLFEIVALAANSGADIFFAIHSNATGTENCVNFPLGLYRGWDNGNAVEGSQDLSEAVMRYQGDNKATVWTHKERSRGDWSFYTNWGYRVGLGVLRYNKLPGMLMEGSFHDYLPERERLLNKSYCWLEAWTQSQGIDEYFKRKKKANSGVLAGVVRWEDVERTDNDTRMFNEDKLKPVNGAMVHLYAGNGSLARKFGIDNLDNGVFVFTNLKPDKYRLELYYGNEEDLYLTTKIRVKKNQTSFRNIKLKTDQKPKHKKK